MYLNILSLELDQAPNQSYNHSCRQHATMLSKGLYNFSFVDMHMQSLTLSPLHPWSIHWLNQEFSFSLGRGGEREREGERWRERDGGRERDCSGNQGEKVVLLMPQLPLGWAINHVSRSPSIDTPLTPYSQDLHLAVQYCSATNYSLCWQVFCVAVLLPWGKHQAV